jgi:hypothetical protein
MANGKHRDIVVLVRYLRTYRCEIVLGRCVLDSAAVGSDLMETIPTMVTMVGGAPFKSHPNPVVVPLCTSCCTLCTPQNRDRQAISSL